MTPPKAWENLDSPSTGRWENENPVHTPLPGSVISPISASFWLNLGPGASLSSCWLPDSFFCLPPPPPSWAIQARERVCVCERETVSYRPSPLLICPVPPHSGRSKNPIAEASLISVTFPALTNHAKRRCVTHPKPTRLLATPAPRTMHRRNIEGSPPLTKQASEPEEDHPCGPSSFSWEPAWLRAFFDRGFDFPMLRI